ncbi:MAG: hypothetical protein K2Y42_12640 [Hyphomicrobium sp.]|jgi:hypothetical protein|uniref:hypothetical protein n=1 Tax=Hyphomicrobium sp. TaxID=82 RepID=UPI0025C0D105|nr:hypothetical protein [Hyphomicrobium sp.]MBX9863586.1 hypothetical protein [Hyphomicrobium sp.]
MSPKKDQREAYLQPSREGKKALLLWLPEELHRKLKLSAVEDGVTLQEVGEMVFRAYLGKRSKRKD